MIDKDDKWITRQFFKDELNECIQKYETKTGERVIKIELFKLNGKTCVGYVQTNE